MTREELNFIEWETRAFGCGYGTGETPILKATKIFFKNLEDGRRYDYEILEETLGDTVTWLLINAFEKANIIEWGTSARFGWLNSCGEFVRDFIQSEFQGKELHEWAKSTVESDYFIKYMTIENEIVYDPFMGQGTFGISAIKLKTEYQVIHSIAVKTKHLKKMTKQIKS